MKMRISTKHWLRYWDNNFAISIAYKTFTENKRNSLFLMRKRISIEGSRELIASLSLMRLFENMKDWKEFDDDH